MAFADVRGLLLDIDGTLLVHDRPIPGAAEALRRLRASGLRFLLLTNTSRRSRRATAERLQQAGFDVGEEAIVTPARLARRRILDSGRVRAGLLVAEEARVDLEGVEADERRPDWVVVGDIGAGFTFARMNDAFRWLRAGAGLIALHKNPWWDKGGEEGVVLDGGAYVAALEYATGGRAEVVGKPSPEFFELALAEVACPPTPSSSWATTSTWTLPGARRPAAARRSCAPAGTRRSRPPRRGLTSSLTRSAICRRRSRGPYSAERVRHPRVLTTPMAYPGRENSRDPKEGGAKLDRGGHIEQDAWLYETPRYLSRSG